MCLLETVAMALKVAQGSWVHLVGPVDSELEVLKVLALVVLEGRGAVEAMAVVEPAARRLQSCASVLKILGWMKLRCVYCRRLERTPWRVKR